MRRTRPGWPPRGRARRGARSGVCCAPCLSFCRRCRSRHCRARLAFVEGERALALRTRLGLASQGHRDHEDQRQDPRDRPDCETDHKGQCRRQPIGEPLLPRLSAGSRHKPPTIRIRPLRDHRERSQPERTGLPASGSSRAGSRVLALVSCLALSRILKHRHAPRPWPAPRGSATSGSHHFSQPGRCRRRLPGVKNGARRTRVSIEKTGRAKVMSS